MAKLAGFDSSAATTIGCNPDTLAKHYVGIRKTDIPACMAKKLAGLLDTTSEPDVQQIPASTGGKM